MQLKQWLEKNKSLKGKELADGVATQNWDPSVQALAAFPAVVDKLANNIQWTTDLGNAFLAQQNDVINSVQDLRATAQANGVLKSNDKQKVAAETTNEGKQAITIESAQRDVVYVPTYNTKYVYRNSGYSDDSSYSSGYSNDYSSGSSGYSSGSSDSGYSYLAYAAGAATGYYYGRYNWRDGNGYTNGDNYYVKNYNSRYNNNNNGNSYRNNANNGNNNSSNSLRNNTNNISQRLNDSSGKWQHDPSHRGSTPYGNSDLATRFGQANNRAGNSSLTNQASQLSRTHAPRQAANVSRAPGGARSGVRAPNAGGAPNRIGDRAPSNFPGGARGGALSSPQGDLARASSLRGAQSLQGPGGLRGGAPGGFRGGPPSGFGGGGPPMGGGFRGGGPPMGGFGGGGPPMGGGMPGPPPAPPHP